MIKLKFDAKMDSVLQLTIAEDEHGNPVVGADGKFVIHDTKVVLEHPKGGTVALPLHQVPEYLAKGFGKATLEIVEKFFVESMGLKQRGPLSPKKAVAAFMDMVM